MLYLGQNDKLEMFHTVYPLLRWEFALSVVKQVTHLQFFI